MFMVAHKCFRAGHHVLADLERCRIAEEEPSATAEEEPSATAEEEPSATAEEEPLATAEEEPLAISEKDALAPNISLNLHGGSKSGELFAGAIFGVVLQVGILVFCGFTVYHTSFRERFPKEGRHVPQYGFPIMLSGTVLLVIGMMVCSLVVEQSTCEVKYVLGLTTKGGTKKHGRVSCGFRGPTMSAINPRKQALR